MLSIVPEDGASASVGAALPCHGENPDLWFAERPDQLTRAQRLCQGCPIRLECFTTALARREPWGGWGGEIFDRGEVVPFKRGRGRPAKVRTDYRESTPA